ncbi:unnamed protein product [Peniophora sp. CBMAI 1063]|nr:unnamed protein product [Peniophora sp. CBMAI 1063]
MCSLDNHDHGASDAAYKQLFVRNHQWRTATSASQRDFYEFRDTSGGQKPSILWIGCSDSRVPDNVITGSSLGTIFTHRNIANQFLEGDNNAAAVLEFAVTRLRVQHIVVAGHTYCGGVETSYNLAYPANRASREVNPDFEVNDERNADEPMPQVVAWLQPLVSVALDPMWQPMAAAAPEPN